MGLFWRPKSTKKLFGGSRETLEGVQEGFQFLGFVFEKMTPGVGGRGGPNRESKAFQSRRFGEESDEV